MFNFILNEKKYKKIHFIGIGGVSMSGIAMLINAQGYDVSGSDMGDSELLTVLKEKGIKVFSKQVKENITIKIYLYILMQSLNLTKNL